MNKIINEGVSPKERKASRIEELIVQLDNEAKGIATQVTINENRVEKISPAPEDDDKIDEGHPSDGTVNLVSSLEFLLYQLRNSNYRLEKTNRHLENLLGV